MRIQYVVATSLEINKYLKFSKDGLKKLLKRLIEKEEIEMVGAGPNTEYKLLEIRK